MEKMNRIFTSVTGLLHSVGLPKVDLPKLTPFVVLDWSGKKSNVSIDVNHIDSIHRN